jgi:integrase
LIIAFAALFALRRKNLGEIQRGTHMLEDASTVRLAFSDTLKNRTSVLFDIPDWMMPRLELYLTQLRPRLLGKAKDHGGLWVSRRGTQLSPISIGAIFNDFGETKLGRHLNCHVLRHAMDNTIIIRNPGDNDLAAAALGHKTTQMVDEVYSKSASRELSRVWQRKLRARMR